MTQNASLRPPHTSSMACLCYIRLYNVNVRQCYWKYTIRNIPLLPSADWGSLGIILYRLHDLGWTRKKHTRDKESSFPSSFPSSKPPHCDCISEVTKCKLFTHKKSIAASEHLVFVTFLDLNSNMAELLDLEY